MDWTDYQGNWKRYRALLMPRLLELGIIILILALIPTNTWYQFGILMGLVIVGVTLTTKMIKRTKIKASQALLLFGKSFVVGCVLFFMWANLQGWTIILGVMAIAAWKIWQSRTFVKDAIQSGARLLEGDDDRQEENQRTAKPEE